MRVNVPVDWGSLRVSSDPDYNESIPIHAFTGEQNGETSLSLVHRQISSKTRSLLGSGLWANGWRYATPYNARVVSVKAVRRDQSSNHLGTRISKSWPLVTTNALDAVSLTAPEVVAELETLVSNATNGALDKLNQNRIEVGVSLLEARKTFSHLGATAVRVLTLMRAMRRGRFGEAANILGLKLNRRSTRVLASNWLEYKYAWLPLLSDVKAAYDIAQQGIDVPLMMSVVRDVKGTIDVPIPRYVKVDYSSEHWQGSYEYLPEPCTVGCKVRLTAKVNSTELARLKQFGLANPASIAWELVPWSFVIDWFVPVGEFLNALTATYGLLFIDGSVSRYVSISTEHESYPSSASSNKRWPFEAGGLKMEAVQVGRTALQTFPRPVLTRKNHLAVDKAVTAAALWRVTSSRR